MLFRIPLALTSVIPSASHIITSWSPCYREHYRECALPQLSSWRMAEGTFCSKKNLFRQQRTRYRFLIYMSYSKFPTAIIIQDDAVLCVSEWATQVVALLFARTTPEPYHQTGGGLWSSVPRKFTSILHSLCWTLHDPVLFSKEADEPFPGSSVASTSPNVIVVVLCKLTITGTSTLGRE